MSIQILSDGVQRDFTIPGVFYQLGTGVTINGLPASFTWLNADTLRLDAAPTAGGTVVIEPNTVGLSRGNWATPEDVQANATDSLELDTALTTLAASIQTMLNNQPPSYQVGQQVLFKDAPPDLVHWGILDTNAPSALGFSGNGPRSCVVPFKKFVAQRTGGAFVFGEWNGWTYYAYNYSNSTYGHFIERVNNTTQEVQTPFSSPMNSYYYNYYGGPVGGIVGNYMYLFGGSNGGVGHAAAYRINLTNGASEAILSLPSYLWRGTAVTIGTKIYMIGGITNSAGPVYNQNIIVFDTVAGSYASYPLNWSITENKACHMSNGNILITDGGVGNYCVWNPSTQSIVTAVTAVNDGIGFTFGIVIQLPGETKVRALKNKASIYGGVIVEFDPATGVWTDTNISVDYGGYWSMGFTPSTKSVFQPSTYCDPYARQQRFYFDYEPIGATVRAYFKG